jgi:uncharacterized protein
MKELESLNTTGFARIKNFLTVDQCADLIKNYSNDKLYRNTIDMTRYRFGEGQYRYFNYPLPDLVQKTRTSLYEPLAVIANEWNEKLSIDVRYPKTHKEFIEVCHKHNQLRPTPLILRYEVGGIIHFTRIFMATSISHSRLCSCSRRREKILKVASS